MPRTYASMKLRVQDLSLAYDRAGVRQRVLDGLAFELVKGSSSIPEAVLLSLGQVARERQVSSM